MPDHDLYFKVIQHVHSINSGNQKISIITRHAIVVKLLNHPSRVLAIVPLVVCEGEPKIPTY